VDNLGEHGIHPRSTHVLVNLQMLFGPLAFFFYVDVVAIALGWLLPGRYRRTNNQQQRTQRDISHSRGRSMCIGSVVSGLFVLSCAPHQEPRFLLPSIVLLVVVLYGTILTEGRRRWFRNFWILFHALLLIFFGVLHQSGVVRSLLASHEIASAHGSGSGPSLFVYHHTYMPPSFLTRTRRGSVEGKEEAQCTEEGTCSAISRATSGMRLSGNYIVDLKDADMPSLQRTLNAALACQLEGVGESEVFVVNPSTAQFWPPFFSGGIMPAISLVTYQSAHITTEDMPPHTHSSNGRLDKYASGLHLNTHKVSCSSQRISKDGTLQHFK
jgi:phosphatidylinositol glycan class Z